MISKGAFKEVILDYHRIIPRLTLIKRDIAVEPSSNYVFVGLRRAGKSYMMFADILRRVSVGECGISDVLYVNFEDERLSGASASDLSLMLEAYRELFPDRSPLIYLDEIQNVDGWEKFVRRLADTAYHVWVTGSNARMLSREMATTLGGRFIVKHIPTFSFREYLRFLGEEPGDDWRYDVETRSRLAHRLSEYFRFGGFAETFRLADKREWLNSLYQKVLLGDVAARKGFRNDRALMLLVRKIAESVKQPVTQTRLLNIIKTTGVKAGRNTIADYLHGLDESFLTFSVANYRQSLAERTLESKRYFSDNGLLNLFLIDGATSLLENMVAVELQRKHIAGQGEEFFYYRNGVEVDFYLPASRTAIQASYSLKEGDTLLRETESLIKLSKSTPIDRAVIVTYDDEPQELCAAPFPIESVPLIDFLL